MKRTRPMTFETPTKNSGSSEDDWDIQILEAPRKKALPTLDYAQQCRINLVSWFNAPMARIGTIWEVLMPTFNQPKPLFHDGFHPNAFCNEKAPTQTLAHSKYQRTGFDVAIQWILNRFTFSPPFEHEENLEDICPTPFRTFQTLIWLMNPVDLKDWLLFSGQMLFSGNEYVALRRRYNYRNLCVSPYFKK